VSAVTDGRRVTAAMIMRTTKAVVSPDTRLFSILNIAMSTLFLALLFSASGLVKATTAQPDYSVLHV